MKPDQSLSTGQEIDVPPSAGGFGWRTAFFIAAIVIAFGLGSWSSRKLAPAPDSQSFATSASFEKPVVVQISGQVKNPGVYELPFNSRIYHAIAKAGGSLANADLDSINLADWVEDGSQIDVPAKNVAVAENSPPAATELPPLSEIPPLGLDSNSQNSTPLKSTFTEAAKSKSIQPASPKPPKSTFKETPKSPIDLNRATSEELQQLPGVGPAMADRILQYRKENQGFTSVDDLDNVRGIGPKKLEKIKPFVLVKPLPFQKTGQ